MTLGTVVVLVICTLNSITRKEYEGRLDIFSSNLARYEEHNLSGSSWRMGVTQFSDLTQAEFESLHMGGFRAPPAATPTRSWNTTVARSLPSTVDWRESGVLTDVKNQVLN